MGRGQTTAVHRPASPTKHPVFESYIKPNLNQERKSQKLYDVYVGGRASRLWGKNIAHQGMVKSIMVDPARAPTPTDSCCCALSPMPEKRTIAPSGTAPNTGSTTEPTRPATAGTSRRSSEPSDIMLDALQSGHTKQVQQCKAHKSLPRQLASTPTAVHTFILVFSRT